MYEAYTVDQSKLPQVWVTWASTKNKKFNKRYWLHCQNGTRKDTPESWMNYDDEPLNPRYGTFGYYGARGQSCPYIWVDSGTKLNTTYVKWHDDIQKLEIAAVNIDTSRKDTPRQWEYAGERMFVGKDKVFSYTNCEGLGRTQIYKDHYASRPQDALCHLRRLDLCLNWRDEVVKLTGETFTTIGGYKNDIRGFYALEYWLTHRVKTIKQSPKQALVEELTAIELPPLDTSKRSSYVVYSKVNDSWSCLRLIDWYGNESKRIYFDEGKKVQTAVKVGDTWCESMFPKYSGSNLFNSEDACAQSNRVKHILEALSSEDRRWVSDLILALRFPEFEQAAKLGVRMKTTLGTPFKDLEDRFGGYYNHKATNFLRKVGLTKPQLDILVAYEAKHGTRYCYNHFDDPLRLMRKVFGDDLSPIDIATFKKHFDAFCAICANCYTLKGLKFSIPGLDTQRFFKNLVRLNERHPTVYQVVDDTLASYQRLIPDNRPEINWYFDAYSDITRCHDAVDELYREQQREEARLRSLRDAERLAAEDKKRAKLDEKRKELEFEDGDYVIRLPKSSAEILMEGQLQRICIGSYTTRHATGETNLFFLRKKSDPETPFYAIQMNNDRNIVQIHGYCNKWLGNNPEAIPTVMRWLRANDIKCDKHILTCKATGYSRISDCVALPVID